MRLTTNAQQYHTGLESIVFSETSAVIHLVNQGDYRGQALGLEVRAGQRRADALERIRNNVTATHSVELVAGCCSPHDHEVGARREDTIRTSP